MTDTIKKRAKIISRLTTWILRLLIIGTVLFFAFVLLTAMLSGNGEIQKSSLEGSFQSFFGRKVKIQTLHTFDLLPTLVADFDGLVVLNDAGDEPVLILEHGRYAHDPLQHFMGGEKIINLTVKNLLTAPGYVGPYSLHFASGDFAPLADGVDAGDTTFDIAGNYGGYDLTINFPAVARRHSTVVQYRLAGEKTIRAQLGGVKLTGSLQLPGKAIILDPVTISDDKGMVTGMIAIPLGQPDVTVAFKLMDADSGLTLDASALLKDHNITVTGTLGADQLSLAPQKLAQTNLLRVMNDLIVMLQQVRQTDAGGRLVTPATLDIALDLNVKSFTGCTDVTNVTNITAKLAGDGQNLKLNDLSLHLGDEKLTGQGSLHALNFHEKNLSDEARKLTRCFH
jgi:hypothetical protein